MTPLRPRTASGWGGARRRKSVEPGCTQSPREIRLMTEPAELERREEPREPHFLLSIQERDAPVTIGVEAGAFVSLWCFLTGGGPDSLRFVAGVCSAYNVRVRDAHSSRTRYHFSCEAHSFVAESALTTMSV